MGARCRNEKDGENKKANGQRSRLINGKVSFFFVSRSLGGVSVC